MNRKINKAKLRQSPTRDLEKRIATLEAAVREKEAIEAGLRESESRYRALVENLNDVIYTLDTNGCFTYISPAIEQHSAYKVDDIIGRNFSELVHPDDLPRLLESFSRTMRNENEPFECRVFDREGQVRYIRSASRPVFHKGLIVGIAGLMTDITERKLAEETLRKSEENLSITLHSIGDGVISTDKNGLVVRMNPVAEKLCGRQLAEAAGKPLAEVFNIVNVETRETVADPVKRVLESGETAGLANHTILIAKDGTEYQIADSAAPITTKDGEISGVVLVFSDVTETYVAQKQLKESEERYRRLLQNLEAGIVVHAPDTSIVMNNPRAAELLGLSDDQMRGKTAIEPAWKFVNDDKTTLPFNDYPVNQIVTAKKPLKDQLLGILQPGKNDIVWVTVNGFPVLNNIGDITEIVISFIDVTKRKQAEETLKQSEREKSLLLNSTVEMFAYYDLDCACNGQIRHRPIP
jgi:PAS domain S-box-containing protein